MGRGDRKTRKGKIAIRSHGNVRPHAVKKATGTKPAATASAAPPKAAVKKTAPAKKATAKKTS